MLKGEAPSVFVPPQSASCNVQTLNRPYSVWRPVILAVIVKPGTGIVFYHPLQINIMQEKKKNHQMDNWMPAKDTDCNWTHLLFFHFYETLMGFSIHFFFCPLTTNYVHIWEIKF